jgi:hypothetical protein
MDRRAQLSEILIITQLVAVPSSTTLPSFIDNAAVARDWPVLGVG